MALSIKARAASMTPELFLAPMPRRRSSTRSAQAWTRSVCSVGGGAGACPMHASNSSCRASSGETFFCAPLAGHGGLPAWASAPGCNAPHRPSRPGLHQEASRSGSGPRSSGHFLRIGVLPVRPLCGLTLQDRTSERLLPDQAVPRKRAQSDHPDSPTRPARAPADSNGRARPVHMPGFGTPLPASRQQPSPILHVHSGKQQTPGASASRRPTSRPGRSSSCDTGSS